jgi:hypothetical protein
MWILWLKKCQTMETGAIMPCQKPHKKPAGFGLNSVEPGAQAVKSRHSTIIAISKIKVVLIISPVIEQNISQKTLQEIQNYWQGKTLSNLMKHSKF